MARGNSRSSSRELDDPLWMHAAVALAIHLERARRAEHCRPLDVFVGRADICRRRQQQKVLHVEDPRGLVGAFQVAAQPAEMPALVVRHRRVGDAGELVARHFDDREQMLGVAEAVGIEGRRVDHQVELVQLLPHLRRDHLADRARVLAGGAETGSNRVGVVGIVREELNDALLGGGAIAVRELLCIARRIDERLPLLHRADRHVEHQVERHVDEARDVLRPLDIAAHPVDRVGDAAQHCDCAPLASVPAADAPWLAGV